MPDVMTEHKLVDMMHHPGFRAELVDIINRTRIGPRGGVALADAGIGPDAPPVAEPTVTDVFRKYAENTNAAIRLMTEALRELKAEVADLRAELEARP